MKLIVEALKMMLKCKKYKRGGCWADAIFFYAESTPYDLILLDVGSKKSESKWSVNCVRVEIQHQC